MVMEMNFFQEIFLRVSADHYGYGGDFDFILVTYEEMAIKDRLTSKMEVDALENEEVEEEDVNLNYMRAIHFYKKHIRTAKSYKLQTGKKWSYYVPNGPDYSKRTCDRMKEIFLQSMIKHYHDKSPFDHEFGAKVLYAFAGANGPKMTSTEFESILKEFLSRCVFIPFCYTLNDANVYQQRLLFAAVANFELHHSCCIEGTKYDLENEVLYIRFLDNLVACFNALSLDQEQEFTGQWIKFQYEITIILRDNRIRKRNLTKTKVIENLDEKVAMMEATFIDSISEDENINYKFVSDVIHSFRDKKGPKPSEEDIKIMIYHNLLDECPTASHFLENANIFQKIFFSCTAAHFRDKIDYDFIDELVDFEYLVATFNGLKLNEEQIFPAKWIIDAYESSIEAISVNSHKMEKYDPVIVEKMEEQFILFTRSRYSDHADIKFTANIINLFRNVQKS